MTAADLASRIAAAGQRYHALVAARDVVVAAVTERFDAAIERSRAELANLVGQTAPCPLAVPVAGPSHGELILAHLAQHERASVRELAEALFESVSERQMSAVRMALRRLKNKGRVRRDEDGSWEATAAPVSGCLPMSADETRRFVASIRTNEP